MDNITVARMFMDLAEMLQLEGENQFRVGSYLKAARTMENLPQAVTSMAQQGILRSVPGIGDSINSKVLELANTGHMKVLDELRAKYPEGVLAMLRLQGIGPATVRKLYEMGIDDLDKLEKACNDGTIATLPRMSEAIVAKMLVSIQEQRQTKGFRITLGNAIAIVDEITQVLANDGLTPIATGSVRRWRDTVGDLDICCPTGDSAHAIGAFMKLPVIKDVMVHGEQKVSVITHNGLQLDFRTIPPEHLGSMLQYFTGSKQYNIDLRSRAVRRGIKVSEYGVTIDGVLQMFGSEDDFYEALGIQYVPPELRESGPIIEAAEQFLVPKLVVQGDILGDLHVHSNWSDGAHSIEEIIRACAIYGYKYVAITDHSQSLGIAHGLKPDDLERQIEKIHSLNQWLESEQGGFRVLTGTECDIKRDGTLDFSDDLLAQLDWVIASVHSGMNQSEADMTKRVVEAMRNPNVDCIGHPTCRVINEREPIALDMEAIFLAAIDTNTALELNAHPSRLDLRDTHVNRARELGIDIALGSDAHHIRELGNIRFGVHTARRGWCTANDILNTEVI